MAFRLPEENRVPLQHGLEGCTGYSIKIGNRPFAVIASTVGGWEHLSVSTLGRTPTWEEMCVFKDMFWEDEDEVIQFHPKKSEYVNCHPYTLHLWRKIENKETPQ